MSSELTVNRPEEMRQLRYENELLGAQMKRYDEQRAASEKMSHAATISPEDLLSSSVEVDSQAKAEDTDDADTENDVQLKQYNTSACLVKVECGLIANVPRKLRVTPNRQPCGIFSVTNTETGRVEWRFVKEYEQVRNFARLVKAIVEPLIRLGEARLTNFPPRSLFTRDIPWKVDVRIDMLNAFFKTVWELFKNPAALKHTQLMRSLEQACSALWLHEIVDITECSHNQMIGSLLTHVAEDRWTCNYCILNGAYLDVVSNSTTGPVTKSISLSGAKIIMKISFFDTTDNDERYSIDIYERASRKGYLVHRFSAENERVRQLWISKLRSCVDRLENNEISPTYREFSQMPLPYKMQYSPRVSTFLPAESEALLSSKSDASDAQSNCDNANSEEELLALLPSNGRSTVNNHNGGFFDGGEFYMKVSKPMNFDEPEKRPLQYQNLTFKGSSKGKVFGVPLEKCQHLRRLPNGDEVSSVVARCMQQLNHPTVMSEVGLFRISGTQTLIHEFQEKFDKQGDCDLSGPGIDVHTVADLLKRYFRSLPRSFLGEWTEERSKALLGSTRHDQVLMLQEIQAQYHPISINTSRCILRLLHNVSRYEYSNAMSVWNLSVALSPALKVPPLVLQTYIENQEELFGKK